MPQFIYKALSENGELVKGEIWADTSDLLNQQLENKGLLLQSYKAKKSFFSKSSHQRIKSEYFHLFNQELIALLKAGVSITECLKEVSHRPEQPAFSAILKEILQNVMAGESFSNACRRFPDYFEPLYISALETGESIGDLVPTLNRFQQQLKNRITLQRQFTQALAYPVFLLILLSFVMLILFTFVLPRFVTLYADFGSELPVATQWLMLAVETLPIWGSLLLLILIFTIFAYKSYVKTEVHRQRIDKLILSMPFFGQLIELKVKAQMTRTMASLISSGMPVIDAIKKTAIVLSNRYYAIKLENASELIIGGTSFSSSLESQGLISGAAHKILKAGEKAGNIDIMLDEIADYFEQLLSYKLTRFTGIIEPILMLIVGITVGSIILVMYLPIFSIAEIIQ